MTSGAGGVGGYAIAGAGAFGFVAKGGTATATTTVSNSGNLITHYGAVYGYAVALSDTIGGTTKGGSATGGTSHRDRHDQQYGQPYRRVRESFRTEESMVTRSLRRPAA